MSDVALKRAKDAAADDLERERQKMQTVADTTEALISQSKRIMADAGLPLSEQQKASFAALELKLAVVRATLALYPSRATPRVTL